MAIITLHRVALGVCDMVGDTSQKELAKIMRYGNVGVKDLYNNVVPLVSELNVTSKIIKIGDNFFVDLPEDYVYYTKVGICFNGRICLLGLDETLCAVDTNNQNCPCTEESTATVTSICCGTYDGSLYPYTFYGYRNGQQVGELYGLSGGNCWPGYFKEDKKNNRLILSSDLPGSEVIIEYKADETLNGVATIPSEIELAVQLWMLWYYNMNRRPQVARGFKNDYETEYNKLKKLYSSRTESEWRSTMLQATTSTVKR